MHVLFSRVGFEDPFLSSSAPTIIKTTSHKLPFAQSLGKHVSAQFVLQHALIGDWLVHPMRKQRRSLPVPLNRVGGVAAVKSGSVMKCTMA